MNRDLAALNAAKQASDNKRAAQAKQNQQAAIQEERETLQGMTFPAELIPDWFDLVLYKTLRHNTVVTLNCDWPTFKVLLNEKPIDFNLHQMAKALNAIEAATPVQLDREFIEYTVVQDKIAEMAAEWNNIVGPIRAAITDKYK